MPNQLGLTDDRFFGRHFTNPPLYFYSHAALAASRNRLLNIDGNRLQF
jgi:hypothetical protein